MSDWNKRLPDNPLDFDEEKEEIGEYTLLERAILDAFPRLGARALSRADRKRLRDEVSQVAPDGHEHILPAPVDLYGRDYAFREFCAEKIAYWSTTPELRAASHTCVWHICDYFGKKFRRGWLSYSSSLPAHDNPKEEYSGEMPPGDD